MIGMVLAAGAGRRLRPYTDTLPKALVPVDGETTILDIALRNFAEVGLTDVVIVVGYAAGAVEERRADLERSYGVALTLVHNDKAEKWNNAYSLWLARDHLARRRPAGQRRHRAPGRRSRRRCWPRAAPSILLAIDTVKKLADEEMKVRSTPDGWLTRITKLMDPATAFGEYIGATLIEPAVGRARSPTRCRPPSSGTRTSTTRTATRSWSNRGGRIDIAPIPAGTSWVEVDDHATSPRPGRSRAGTSQDAGEPAVRRHPVGGRWTTSPSCCTSGTLQHGQCADRGGPSAGRRHLGPDLATACRDATGLRGARRQPRRRRCPPARRWGQRGYDAVVGDRRRQDPRRRQVRRHPCRPCRWSRSPRTSRTTASARRSPPWSTRTARAPTGWRCRSPSSWTSTSSAPPRVTW